MIALLKLVWLSPGFYCLEGTSRRPSSQFLCPQGYYCEEGTAVPHGSPCPAGTAGGQLGQTSRAACKRCSEGRYCPTGKATHLCIHLLYIHTHTWTMFNNHCFSVEVQDCRATHNQKRLTFKPTWTIFLGAYISCPQLFPCLLSLVQYVWCGSGCWGDGKLPCSTFLCYSSCFNCHFPFF